MELLDKYDKNRIKIGTVNRNDKDIRDQKYRLVVHGAVFNEDGELLVQQRSSTKSLWPGLWDISVGGAALSGETSEEAIIRELNEELGIKVNKGIRPVITHHFSFGFDDFYIFKLDVNLEDITIEENEVDDIKWMSKEEIFDKIDSKDFIEYEKKFIDLLFYFKDNINIMK